MSSDCAFKDLVIDATDGIRMGEFWAAAIGLNVAPHGDAGNAVLTGANPEQTIWINQVPEPRTVKQRVHCDLHTADVRKLIKLGARVDVEHKGWMVLRDLEDGEFCAFAREPDQVGDYRMYELVVDTNNAERICRWWGDRFDLEAKHDEQGPWWWLEGGSLPYPMVFNPVPEPKTVKNRVHWDVWGRTPDYQAVGATLIRARDDVINWDVLADGDGNEFCVFTR